jgi:hypothetical protein
MSSENVSSSYSTSDTHSVLLRKILGESHDTGNDRYDQHDYQT